MTQFKVGDRVRLKERYATAEVGTEGTVARTKGGLLYVDTLMAAHAGIFAGRFELIESRKDTPRVGDTVRVVLEGEVTYVGGLFFTLTAGVTDVSRDGDEVKSVEIIKPAKPSVADLPEGSVVLSGSAGGTPFARLRTQSKYWYEPGHTDAYVAEDLDEWGWTLLVEQASE